MKADYDGVGDGSSGSKIVFERCKRISKLRMEYRSKNGNRLVANTPGELYNKSISIVASLPEDATNWPPTV